MAKKLPKDQIVKVADAAVKLTAKERKIFDFVEAGAPGSGDDATPYVILKYFRHSYECFSDWEKNELKLFSDLLKDLSERTWKQVLQSSSKIGGKRGLAYTAYDVAHTADSAKEVLQNLQRELSPDITFFELRVDQNRLRIHGFRAKAAFFLVLLDREHRVFPE